MEMINILLIGNDMDYCKALSESISELSNEIMITLYDKRNVNLDKMNQHSIILVEAEEEAAEEAAEEEEAEEEEAGEEKQDFKKIQKNKHPVLLVERQKEACMDIENRVFCLYKYENVKEIIRSIFIIYNVLTGKRIASMSDNNCKIIAVTSSYGGSGKTSVSLGLAQEFVRFRDKKTLYINYEDCDGTWNYMDFKRDKKDDCIGNYLYYLNKGRNYDLYAFLKQDEYGVYYFKPSLGRNQLKGLCAEDLCIFCNKMIETNMFEYIIFDCHACLDDSTLWLLKNSFRIVYLAEGILGLDVIDHTQRDRGAIEFIENKFSSKLGEKLIQVYNMHQSATTEVNNKEIVIIETHANCFQIVNGIRKINIERQFGEGIKWIANKIEEL